MLSFVLLFACSTPSAPAVAEPSGELVAADHAAHHEAAEHAATVHHRFDDPEKWSKVFDDPERDAWQQPDVVVSLLGLHPGDAVADIGAGTGYFNARLARAVGQAGKVIAVDIEPALVSHMVGRAVRDGTPQVEPRLGKADDPGLAGGEVNVVMLVDTYHHIGDRIGYFRRLRDAVRPGGRLVVIDFKKDPAVTRGPPVAHRLSADAVTAELTEAGWRVSLAEDRLESQYVLVATPEQG